jgi:hypothetical protein
LLQSSTAAFKVAGSPDSRPTPICTQNGSISMVSLSALPQQPASICLILNCSHQKMQKCAKKMDAQRISLFIVLNQHTFTLSPQKLQFSDKNAVNTASIITLATCPLVNSSLGLTNLHMSRQMLTSSCSRSSVTLAELLS